MSEKTIVVQGHFGDKTMTQDRYVERWLDHAKEIKHLCSSSEDLEEVVSILDRVRKLAERRFDCLYSAQNSPDRMGA